MNRPIQVAVPSEPLAAFCRRWRVAELLLFGSVLRDDFRPESDVDVLVTFAPGTNFSLFDLTHMRRELEDLFHRAVDLVDRKVLEESPNYLRRKEILRTAEVVYAA